MNEYSLAKVQYFLNMVTKMVQIECRKLAFC